MNTKKIVITGGPGTGKSTIINELTKRGYTCLEEVSRHITLEAKKKGVDQLFLKDPLMFSELLLKGRHEQFIKAQRLDSSAVFFDRGIPDILAYLNYIGCDYPHKFNELCETTNYDFVFILKPWKAIYTTDNERYEDFNQAQNIHNQLVNTYTAYNYTLIDVPFGSVSKRTHFILNVLDM